MDPISLSAPITSMVELGTIVMAAHGSTCMIM